MKKFLLKLSIFTGLVSLIVLSVLHFGKNIIDSYYIKHTSPQQNSMIVGDSKTIMGILPDVIDRELASQFDLPMYNYSFTLGQMAFGPGWLRVIRQKVNPDVRDGLFILSVNPWVLAQREDDDFANRKFFEDNVAPVNMRTLSINPNLEYFFRNYENFKFKALLKTNVKVHDNGWLEPFNIPKNEKERSKAVLAIQKQYEKNSNRWNPSAYRVSMLDSTVSFLKTRGTVVLVRMPGSSTITKIENDFWPNFDESIAKLAQRQQIDYLNFSVESHPFKTYDGLHMDPGTAKRFSRALCDSISRIAP